MRMHPTKRYFLLAATAFSLCFSGCKKWDEHNELNNNALGKSLLDEISSRSDLSKFKEYLQKTGLDKEIASSKTYTVWAPTNTALQTLEASIVNDSAQLRAVLSNHIANLSYYTTSTQGRVQLLNGKWTNFAAKKFDDAAISNADFTVANGVLHTIDKVVKPLPNIWEFINSTTADYKQNAYLAKINFKVRDLTNAIVDSIGQLTGQPVYRPGTDSVIRNRFLSSVLDVKDESKLFTYFVIRNDNFTKEADSLNAYFKTSRTDSTDTLSRFQVIKDLAFEGLYELNQLPDTLTSKSGVKVPINKNAIVQTLRMSNGIVYVMDKVDVPNINRLSPIIVQGEQPFGFLADRRGNTNYRVQLHPNGTRYNDIQIAGHGVSNYWVQYRVNGVPSAKYKVYWVAVNNFNAGATFTQRLAMGATTAPASSFNYTNVTSNNYNEILLGEYTVPAYGILDMFLTANGTGPLSLDYIKLVPSN